MPSLLTKGFLSYKEQKKHVVFREGVVDAPAEDLLRVKTAHTKCNVNVNY